MTNGKQTERRSDAALSTLRAGLTSGTNPMQISAVHACVTAISETVASLPLFLYERTGESREKARDNPLYSVLASRPNADQTRFEFIESIVVSVLLRGNSYSFIESNRNGEILSLTPMSADKVEVKRKGKEKIYLYKSDNGTDPIVYRDWQVLHVRTKGDGLTGRSIVDLARTTIDYAADAEKADTAFYKNGASPSLVLKHPTLLTDDAYNRLINSWESRHSGVDNAGKVALLEEGIEIDTISVSKRDSEFIATREFQITDIARWFRVPPHIIADLSRSTFSNVEQQSIDFVMHTIRPWLSRIEQSMMRDLLPGNRDGTYHIEFGLDGLLRGDTESRQSFYASGITNGWLSPNDVRAKENLPAIENGDVYLVPLNLHSIENLVGYSPVETKKPTVPDATDTRSTEPTKEYRNTDKHAAQVRASADKLIAALLPAFTRAVNIESNDITGKIKSLSKSGALDFESFSEWLSLYFTETAPGNLVRQIESILELSVPLTVQKGIDIAESEIFTESTARADAFVLAYMASLAAAWSDSAIELLSDPVTDEEKTVDTVLLETVQQRKETLPATAAQRHGRRVTNAALTIGYSIAGVEYLYWRARGDSCEFCQKMNGKRAKIGESFLNKGSSVESGENELKISHNISHGPLHDGCDCIVTP